MIKDKANELARAIISSKEYQEYKEARKDLEKDENDYEILETYRQRQLEIQIDELLGKEATSFLSNEVEEIYNSFVDNEKINNFLLAEYRFTKILTEVQDILLDSIESSKKQKEESNLH